MATAFAATVTDPRRFRSGRQFAAWLGLTPLANSSGGKERMGRISKMGDPYLRRFMVVGATSLVGFMAHSAALLSASRQPCSHAAAPADYQPFIKRLAIPQCTT